MKTARPRGDPDFTGDAVAVDNDLARVVQLDFKYAVGGCLKVEIGRFNALFDTRERYVYRLIEFSFVHRFPPCIQLSKPC